MQLRFNQTYLKIAEVGRKVYERMRDEARGGWRGGRDMMFGRGSEGCSEGELFLHLKVPHTQYI